MRKQRVELLAPAGDFACFRAAVNAGADAVYLGGEQYGARAYAGNFSSEEIVNALKIAHIFDRKIYLTVNTLVKESEFGALIPYIAPLYDAGLDGVIVQDIGVLNCLHDTFPDLELHASTQITVTGVYGAAYLKKLGVCRVVPARELSLGEVRDIKEKTGLEIECFIHGAMCYAYSGQCLFSSILGGRSGNRGRCAGPCRLPYTACRLPYTGHKNRTQYPLSLKDMYTLPMLPELIRAGIDSFKIEGRMKSPEYVAGVTAMYRKYIDLYLENPEKAYRIDPKDEQMIRKLYIRSDICDGYYHRHNDKSMVTLKEPGYSGSSPEVLKDIREQYISRNILLPVTGFAKIYAENPAELTFVCNGTSVSVTGETASQALSKPLSREDISQRLGKLGDTCFSLSELVVDTDGASFMPVKALNELRRTAVSQLERVILEQNSSGRKTSAVDSDAERISACRKTVGQSRETNVPCVLVTTCEQLLAANAFSEIRSIYIDADLFLREAAAQKSLLPDKEYFLVLPHIFRKRTYKYLSSYEALFDSGSFAGVMVRNFEELEWLNETGYTGRVESDYTVYAWNNTSLAFLSEQLDCVTLPLELNRRELNKLSAGRSTSLVLYGHIPMMYSANCVRKTLDHCINDGASADNKYYLTDRYQNIFTVVQNCIHCYNVLYNTVPLSLHGQLEDILKKSSYHKLRLDFSIESETQTRAVIEYYLGLMTEIPCEENAAKVFPYKEFTNGHYKRGVE